MGVLTTSFPKPEGKVIEIVGPFVLGVPCCQVLTLGLAMTSDIHTQDLRKCCQGTTHRPGGSTAVMLQLIAGCVVT